MDSMKGYEELGGDAGGGQLGDALFEDFAKAEQPINPQMMVWPWRVSFDAQSLGMAGALAKQRGNWRRELDAERGRNGKPPVFQNPNPPSVIPVVHGRLHVDGPRVFDDAGPWRWKLVTAFGALRRLIDGEDLSDYRDWTYSVGGNGWRVFGGFAANSTRPELDYRKERVYPERLDELCTRTAEWGLRLELAAVCDGIPGAAEQGAFLEMCADVLQRYDHTLLTFANEPWKNGLDPMRFRVGRPGLLVARGANQPDVDPYMPSLGYTTYHPPRTVDWWRKVGKDCREIRDTWTHDFVVSDEPMGAAEYRSGSRSNDPREFFAAGVAAAMFTSGITGHGDGLTMQNARPAGPTETACIRELFRGVDFVPLDAPAWRYARYGQANPGVPMPVQPPLSGEDGRMHAMLGESMGIAINYEDLEGWTAEGRNGWTVQEQAGPAVLVTR